MSNIVAYTNNGILLCLACVDRFGLTDEANRHPEDEFLPVDRPLMDANLSISGSMKCGSPVCDFTFGVEQ